RELDAHPLRVGLSAEVTVDIRHADGKVLAAGPARAAAQTTVYDNVAHAADAEADKVIAANLGTAH
ncbi:MAG TPA: EmrA/EmrK family multidrug efflux transporter periplasmic adaptor subunit, partial [Rhodanobacter sp.]|nr:EmrA/EmrK family multidrug efflux transporter periplasmic adaptor subunit [Rhodanobacter sp.]